MSSSKERCIFVTVGTTLFDSLIESVVSEQTLVCMASHGYTRLIIQYGKGQPPLLHAIKTKIKLECFDFKPSLQEDMLRADLIVSHAGAGTVMETLKLESQTKPTVAVVINSRLMDNHQTELAEAMGERGHLYVIPDPALLQKEETWSNLETFVAVPKEPGDPSDFPRVLNSFFGFYKDR
jgi:beta-1,4-N-acetylglucosaminyltransferase